jgi:hypothetical protein
VLASGCLDTVRDLKMVGIANILHSMHIPTPLIHELLISLSGSNMKMHLPIKKGKGWQQANNWIIFV